MEEERTYALLLEEEKKTHRIFMDLDFDDHLWLVGKLQEVLSNIERFHSGVDP